jgi:hypothetical protein
MSGLLANPESSFGMHGTHDRYMQQFSRKTWSKTGHVLSLIAYRTIYLIQRLLKIHAVRLWMEISIVQWPSLFKALRNSQVSQRMGVFLSAVLRKNTAPWFQINYRNLRFCNSSHINAESLNYSQATILIESRLEFKQAQRKTCKTNLS